MRPLALLLATTFLAPAPLAAQIRASERASVMQTVDGTELTVTYSRPRARGRDTLYGKVVPWGRAWTAGADSATKLRLSRAVRILGRAVPAARYSVWLVPRKDSAWTFVLDPRDTLFHAPHPDSTAQQIRIPVATTTVPATDVLTWWFPAVSAGGATLQMRWGTVAVDVPIEVTSTFPLTVSESDAAPYVGVYDLAYTDTRMAQQRWVMTIARRADGALVASARRDSTRAPQESQLLPAGPDRFARAYMVRGELWTMDEGARVVFLRAGGAVSGFEVRRDSTVEARGTRRP